jgi:hypothetical protein
MTLSEAHGRLAFHVVDLGALVVTMRGQGLLTSSLPVQFRPRSGAR